MNSRRLHILLALWCILVIAPAVIMKMGFFGFMDANTVIPGKLVLLWVLGYLAQFGVFMVIMRFVGKPMFLPWLVSSLLPWIADWSTPVSTWYFLPCLMVEIAIAAWISVIVGRTEGLRQHGIRATGVVLEVLKPWFNVIINKVYLKRKVRLRIEREDGLPHYEAIMNGLFMIGNLPSNGDSFRLLVDPANPKRFECEKN